MTGHLKEGVLVSQVCCGGSGHQWLSWMPQQHNWGKFFRVNKHGTRLHCQVGISQQPSEQKSLESHSAITSALVERSAEDKHITLWKEWFAAVTQMTDWHTNLRQPKQPTDGATDHRNTATDRKFPGSDERKPNVQSDGWETCFSQLLHNWGHIPSQMRELWLRP